MPKKFVKRAIVIATFVVVVGSAIFLLFMLNPSQSPIFPRCPMLATTGLYCSGCGSLRALHQLLHGHFFAALALNPLMVVTLPILLAMFFNPACIYKRWVPW